MTTVADRPRRARATRTAARRVIEVCAACDVDLCWLCLGECTCDHRNVSWADDWTG